MDTQNMLEHDEELTQGHGAHRVHAIVSDEILLHVVVDDTCAERISEHIDRRTHSVPEQWRDLAKAYGNQPT